MNLTVFNNFSLVTEILWKLLLGDNVTDFSNSFTKIDGCDTTTVVQRLNRNQGLT